MLLAMPFWLFGSYIFQTTSHILSKKCPQQKGMNIKRCITIDRNLQELNFIRNLLYQSGYSLLRKHTFVHFRCRNWPIDIPKHANVTVSATTAFITEINGITHLILRNKQEGVVIILLVYHYNVVIVTKYS